MKQYDFSWIDKRLEYERAIQQPGSIMSEKSDRWLVEQFIYPFDIDMWFMPSPAESWERDLGGNDFLGDDDNYLYQLNEYIKKFEK